jgi:antitoxin component of MazEF toxin-antitoxin module
MFTMRRSHVIQPYKVGSKTGKSIAVVIPHEIVEQYKIDPSSIIILKTDKLTKKITLEALEEAEPAENLDKRSGSFKPRGDRHQIMGEQI